MAAKIFALLALLALSISAATAVVIPHWTTPLSVVPTIPQYFPSVATVGSAHSFVQSYRQHQAFVPGISPFSAVIPQLPYLYNQLPISQLPHLYKQFFNPQLPFLYNQLAFSQLPYLYNQLAISQLPYLYNQVYNQLPYLYNQLAISQLPDVYNQLVVANPEAFLPFNQLALRNPVAFWQQPIIGGAFF